MAILAPPPHTKANGHHNFPGSEVLARRRWILVPSPYVAPIVMTNNLSATRILAQKGPVIIALLVAYSVFSHLLPLLGMDLP